MQRNSPATECWQSISEFGQSILESYLLETHSLQALGPILHRHWWYICVLTNKVTYRVIMWQYTSPGSFGTLYVTHQTKLIMWPLTLRGSLSTLYVTHQFINKVNYVTINFTWFPLYTRVPTTTVFTACMSITWTWPASFSWASFITVNSHECAIPANTIKFWQKVKKCQNEVAE